MNFEEIVESAKEEIGTKTPQELHREAALSWGARACALYESTRVIDSGQQVLEVFNKAETFAVAALFHASLSEEDSLGRNLKEVLDQEKAEAISDLMESAEDMDTGEPNEATEVECASCEGCSGDCHDESGDQLEEVKGEEVSSEAK